MEKDLTNWKGCAPPGRKIMEGRYVRLEPLNLERHGDDLYSVYQGDGADVRLKYVRDFLDSRENFDNWVKTVINLQDPIFYAVVDKESGRAGGRQSLLSIDAPNGVVEMGGVLWGPLIARRRTATEGFYLFACYVFEELGYRRLQWKCHNENMASKRAAVRFGFTYEGVFRQHMVQKGNNRDSAWFSIIDKEWPELKRGFQLWLEPSNFDELGNQKKKLEDFRK